MTSLVPITAMRRGKVQSQRACEEQVVIPGIAPALVRSGIADAALKRLAMNEQEIIRNNRHPEAFFGAGSLAAGTVDRLFLPTTR